MYVTIYYIKVWDYTYDLEKENKNKKIYDTSFHL